MVIFHAVIVVLLGIVLLQVGLNLRRLQRLSSFRAARPGPDLPSASVLVPARNEAARIGAALGAWLAQTCRPTEVIVLDDESTDATAERARGAAAGAPWARVLAGAPKPPAWTGKSFACHQLAQVARGDVLVFADADVTPAPEALAALLAAFAEPGTDAVTVLPRHAASSRLGRHALPIQSWVLACFYPLWLAGRRPTALLAAANGQLLAVRRGAYEAVGGHRAVGRSLAEDAELGRRLGAAGVRVRLLDGSDLVSCQGYERLRDLWLANTKNLFAVLFHSYGLAGAAIVGLVAGWVLPGLWLALWAAGLGGDPVLPALQLVLGGAGRIVVARRFGYSVADTWSHPFLALLLALMVGNSVWVHGLGRVPWRGREYAPTASGWEDAVPRGVRRAA